MPLPASGQGYVAQLYKGSAQAARTTLVDGEMGVMVIPGGHLRIAPCITFNDDRIAAIEAMIDAERIATLDVAVLARWSSVATGLSRCYASFNRAQCRRKTRKDAS